MKVKLNSIVKYELFLVVVFLSQTLFAQIQPDGGLRAFDEAVRQSRIEMRQYCALTQQLMKSPTDSIQQAALRHIRNAQQKWNSLMNQFAANPPIAYAKDPKFKSRLSDIAESMADMETYLAAGKFRKSFQNCGMVCGWFVQMHEENGLVYVADRLFYLRKTLKTSQSALQTSDGATLADFIPEIRHQYERVLQAPMPSEKETQLREYFKNISVQLDLLVKAQEKKDIRNVGTILQQLLTVVNDAYGVAL